MISAANPSAMRQQVYSLPSLIREQFWDLESQARKVLSTPEIFSARRIVIVGSGDSHMAALAAELSYWEYAGIWSCVQSSMHASRYIAPFLRPQPPNTPLVLAVSNSGEVARVVEAALAFNAQKAMTVAITANPQSRLGLVAGKVLLVKQPPFAAAPGVRSFVLSLLALHLMAIRLAEVRGQITMDEASELRRQLAGSAEAIEQTLAGIDEPCRQLAQDWSGLHNFEFIGSGPGYGVAGYGAAKVLEAVGAHAVHEETEEWNHLHYFVSHAEDTGTILLAQRPSCAFSRAYEVAAYLKTLQRPHVVVCDTAELFDGGTRRILPVHCPLPEALSPVVFCVPVALFAAYLNEETGAAYGRGSDERWVDSRGGAAVRESRIETPIGAGGGGAS